MIEFYQNLAIVYKERGILWETIVLTRNIWWGFQAHFKYTDEIIQKQNFIPYYHLATDLFWKKSKMLDWKEAQINFKYGRRKRDLKVLLKTFPNNCDEIFLHFDISNFNPQRRIWTKIMSRVISKISIDKADISARDLTNVFSSWSHVRILNFLSCKIQFDGLKVNKKVNFNIKLLLDF